MKIIEDSANRLVLKEGAVGGRIVGGFFGLIGIGMAIAGFVQHKQTMPLVLFGGAIFIIGLLVTLFVSSDTVVADKGARQLTVTFKSLVNRAGKTKQCSFDDVMDVQINQQYEQRVVNNSSNNTNTGGGLTLGVGNQNMNFNNNTHVETDLVTTCTVQLKSGDMITIGREQHEVGGMSIGLSTATLITVGQKLAAVLGVPCQQLGAVAMNPSQVVQNISQAVTNQTGSFVNQSQASAASVPAQPAAATSMPVATPVAAVIPPTQPAPQQTPPSLTPPQS